VEGGRAAGRCVGVDDARRFALETELVRPNDDLLRRLCRARDFIRDSHAEPLELADMAHAAGVSPFHFLRTFRAAFRETPLAFLQRVRLERAKDLLGRGEAVTDVCMQVGYSSLGSFSLLFSRRVGLPPRSFQREVRALVQVPFGLLRPLIPSCFLSRFTSI
jgi:AraC-like DNA-binding protein